MSERSVLDRNLERLLARAYVPVVPAPRFRARLARRLADAVEDTAEDAIAAGAPRAGAARAWKIAAAVLLAGVAALVAWRIRATSDDRGPENAPIAEQGPGPNDGASRATPREHDPDLEDAPIAPLERRSAATDIAPDAGTAADPGSGAATTEDARAPAPATLVLRGRVRGLDPARVADTADPARAHGSSASAKLTVTLLREVRLPAIAEPEVHAVDAVGGAFAIEGVEPGAYAVFVEAPGRATWNRRGVVLAAPDHALDVELEPGVAVRGRVVDASGAPVEDALVVAEADVALAILEFEPSEPVRGAAFARSGPDGRFEIEHASRGVLHLRASRDGHGAGWSKKLDLASVADVDGVDVALTVPGRIFGRVADGKGAPAAHAVVVASWIDYSITHPLISYGFALTDAEGRYSIDDLAPGPYVVLAPSQGPSDPVGGPRVLQATVPAGRSIEIDIPGGPRGAEVRGRLRAHDGAALAGYDVTLMPVEGGLSERWQADQTRADGSWSFLGVRPGRYEVFVGRGFGKDFQLAGEIVVAAAPRVEQDIVLGRCALRGRVASEVDGSALGGSVVVLETERAGRFEFAGKTVADQAGAYAFEGLEEASYRLTAHATRGRFGPERAQAWLTASQPEDEIDFALPRGASLSIRVVRPDGAPIERARITLTDAAGDALHVNAEDVTDAAGAYEVGGIRTGRWTIRAEREGSVAASAVVDLAVDEARAVELVLAPAGSTPPRDR